MEDFYCRTAKNAYDVGEASTMLKRLIAACLSLFLLERIASVVHTQTDPASVGQWLPSQTLPYTPVEAALLPTGKVFFWDQYEKADNPYLWEPETSVVTAAAPAGYNIFCTGFCLLANGGLFLVGGHIADDYGLATAAEYNPSTNSWTRRPDTNAGRWYPTAMALPNGDVLVVSGTMDTTYGMNLLPQVWQAATGSWRSLTSAQLQLPYYPYMYVAPNGNVFNAGPNQTTRYLDTRGTGAWSVVGNNGFGARNWGSSVMFEPGKVMVVGGSTCEPYDLSCGYVPTATAEVIDLNAPSPSWSFVAPMARQRKQHNATLLPDGTVLVTGGTSGQFWDDASSPVYEAELWNPATNTWTTLASDTVHRGYHATALLLPDGRVWSGGGNVGGASAEVFSPPYLFKGARPAIVSVPPVVTLGQTVFVETPDATSIAKVTLLRLSAVTHTFNQGQRFNSLAFSQASGGLNVTLPSSANLVPVGHYLLFILNSDGVPSVAKIIRVDAVQAPPAPTGLTATAASSTQINLTWTDNAGTEDGFKIERCQGAGCTTFAQIATTAANATTYGNTDLTAGASYSYRVRAYNTGGDSAYSNTATAVTTGTAPAAPTNLTAAAVSSTQINLTWTDNASTEDGFKIERCQGAGCTTFAEIATVAASVTSYSNSGLTGGTYSYRVRAYNPTGDSAYSNTATASINTAPNAPTNLAAGASSSSQINLTWTDTAGNEDGFKIERSPSANGNKFVQIATVGPDAVSYSDTQLSASTTYYYRIASYNAAGTSNYSNKASATTSAVTTPPPTAPSNLTATATSSTQINLTWTDNASTEDGFKIERCQGAGCTTFAQIATAAASVTTYGNTDLTAGASYSYRVRAYNTGGDSAYSNTATAVTTGTAPAAPTNLTAAAVSSTQINLTWTDNASTEDGFKIERCQGAGCTTFAEIATVAANATTYGNTDLTAGASYSYRVRAYNTGGDSAYSNTATAVTTGTAPAAPTNLTAAAVSSTQINLTWTDNASTEDGFKIERCQGAGCTTFAEIATVAASVTTYGNTDLTAGASYSYRVRAYNTGGDSAYSNTATAVTTGTAPAAPTNLTAAAVSSTQINLTWTDNASTEDGFKIERCQGAGCTTFAEIATVAASVTTYGNTDLTAGASYSYRVRAYNTGGDSAYSNTATAVTTGTAPAAPTNLTAAAVSSTQINLTWTDNASTEDGFKIERCQGAGCTTFAEIATVAASVTTYGNTDLTAGASYSYRVRAYNTGGDSAYSNTATAVTTGTAPAAPTNLTAAAVSSTQINLTWTDNASTEDGFKIERCQGAGCTTFAEIATVAANATTYGNTDLTAGASYSYRIRAYNSGGDSPYSNTATASTTGGAPTKPTAPTKLAASASSSSQINLTWTDNAGNEAGFKIERSLNANGNKYVEVATVGPDAVSYSDTQLSASTTYYYRVAAYNAAGTSTYSNKASATTSAATTPSAAPSNLTPTAASSTQINAEPPAVSAYLKVATSAQTDVMRDPR